MRQVLVISVSELSLKTAGTIEDRVQDLCRKYKVKYETENQRALWGGKVVAILEGDEEEVHTITELLKTEFKVKNA